MNNRSQVLAILGLGTLIWSVICGPTIAADGPATMPQWQLGTDALSRRPASSSSAATQPSQRPIGIAAIVAEVQMLSSKGIPSSIVFTKEIVAVLTEHKIPIPDDLRQLAVPKPPVPKPTGDEVSRTYRHTHTIVGICRESTWTKTVGFGVTASLRNDLLMAVAKYCPSSLARVEAAMILASRATPDGEGKRVPDVSPAMASTAFEAAIGHALSVSSGSLGPDSIPAIKRAHGLALVRTSFLLKAMALDKPTAEALAKTIADLDTKVAAARKVAKVESSRNTLELLQGHLRSIKARAGQIVQLVSYMNEVREVLKAVVDAVNKEDKEAVAKHLTEKTQLRWAKEESLRAMLANSSKAKHIRFLALGSIGVVGKKFIATASCDVTDDRGKSKRIVWTPYLVKTDTGWLLGAE